MTEFSERHPKAAARFDTGVVAFNLWCDACAEHGWYPEITVYALADTLMSFAASYRQPENLFDQPRFFSRWFHLRKEFATMARRTVKGSTEARAKWQGFIDYRLSEAELDALDSWQPSVAEIWECVDTLMNARYRVTLSYSDTYHTATCSIIDDDPKRKAGGWALASSDTDAAGALKAAVFKHFTVLEGSWERLLDQPNTTGRRG